MLSDAFDGKLLLRFQHQLLTIFSSLYIGVIRIHKANFHVRNNAVLGD